MRILGKELSSSPQNSSDVGQGANLGVDESSGARFLTSTKLGVEVAGAGRPGAAPVVAPKTQTAPALKIQLSAERALKAPRSHPDVEADPLGVPALRILCPRPSAPSPFREKAARPECPMRGELARPKAKFPINLTEGGGARVQGATAWLLLGQMAQDIRKRPGGGAA